MSVLRLADTLRRDPETAGSIIRNHRGALMKTGQYPLEFMPGI